MPKTPSLSQLMEPPDTPGGFNLPGAPAPEQPAHPGSGLHISAYAAPPERPRADQLVRSGCQATNPLRELNGRCALIVATYLITTTATVLSGVRVSCAQPATRCRRNGIGPAVRLCPEPG